MTLRLAFRNFPHARLPQSRHWLTTQALDMKPGDVRAGVRRLRHHYRLRGSLNGTAQASRRVTRSHGDATFPTHAFAAMRSAPFIGFTSAI